MSPIVAKVKVPAIVGTVVTVILAVLSGLAGIPAIAPYVAAGITILHFVAGYLTPED